MSMRPASVLEVDNEQDSEPSADHKQVSWEQIYRQYEPVVRSWISRKSRLGPEFEDLIQLTLVKAWNHLDQFRGEAAFRTWLFRIALNEARQYYRRQIQSSRRFASFSDFEHYSDLVDQSPSVLSRMVRADSRTRLREIVSHLPGPYRDAIVARDFEELSIREAAARLGLTASGLKTRHFRARRELKCLLLKETTRAKAAPSTEQCRQPSCDS